MRIKTLLILIVAFFAVILLANPSSAQGARSGFRALSGAEAAAFQLPDDVVPLVSFDTAVGLTYERYQQKYGGAGADVLGGQLTLYRDSNGQVSTVIGAYYPGITASNNVNLTAVQARGVAANDIGAAGERQVNLMIDPTSGHYFYQVETQRFNSRWIHWINADNGRVVNKYNALAQDCGNVAAPCGFGVQYSEDSSDVKDLTGLVTFSGGQYQLLTLENRIETHDQGSSRRPFLGPIAVDADNSWVALGDESPAQQALVDAHYYAKVADDYYRTQFNYDWLADYAFGDKIEVQAHFTKDYNNATWNGSYIAIGDGDQVSFEELASLDVIGHELTHGVTEFTSNLIYQNESGALNEAFSDMMGSTMEFYAEDNGLEPAASLAPDWLIGEDFDLRGGTNPGFRNMGDPGEDGDPSHYDERYTGTSDNGGVHINSGIANHWYYLLINGGQNSNSSFASGTDVTGLGITIARQIAFDGFTALQTDATFCDARDATIAMAGTNVAVVTDAWDEVGVDSALCDNGSGQNQSPTADFDSSVSGLTANFTDMSSDPDGTVVSWAWDFGDVSSATSQNPSHSYSSSGTYSVVLTVTDNGGATDSVTKSVTVSDGGTTGITLTASADKVRGVNFGVLTWDGATSSQVDIYRDGALFQTTANDTNDNSYTDEIGKGGGSHTYKVCEAGTNNCSNEATISY